MSAPPNWLQNSSAKGKALMLEYKAQRPVVKLTPFNTSAVSGVLKKYDKKQVAATATPKGASQARIDHFMVLVGELIATDPFIREGHPWAARPQAWWAERLEVSTKQVQRISQAAPIRFLTVLNNGTKMTIYRPGSKSDKTPEDYARVMSAMWRAATGRRPTGHEYGLLVGLAKAWPSGQAPLAFKLVIENWNAFCGMAQVEIYCGMHGEPAKEFEAPPEAFEQRYMKYPSISFTRRFWWCAVEMLAIHKDKLYPYKL
jgi:hypothetical protein